MPLLPSFSSACDLAQKMPSLVADFLDVEAGLGRRFREESVTDIIVASLVNLPGQDVFVQVPSETVTGGDFDILLADLASGENFQIRVQAKRLYPHKSNWELGSYRELAHPHNTGKQASTLMRSVAHEKILTVPLYAFYNPRSVCTASGGSIDGVQLAEAHLIREIVRIIVSAKPKRTKLKRISSLQTLFFPLSAILCPATNSAGVLTPRECLAAVEQQIFSVRSREAIELPLLTPEEEEALLIDAPRLSAKFERRERLRSELPVALRRAIERRGERSISRGSVKRPRVVILS